MAYHKIYHWLKYGGKVPRKIKKKYLGIRISFCALNRLKKSVKIIGEPTVTMYETREILPYAFCPKCGNQGFSSINHNVEYPEHWEDFHCTRCRSIVATIDNSPFIHVLENR